MDRGEERGIGRFSQKDGVLSHFRRWPRHYDRLMSTATADSVPPVSLRQDAGVIGLVGLAHMISHYSQLLLAPLFPWLKEAFNASYIELGFLMTLFFVVSCAVQAASGFLVDRYGPRPILFGGLTLLGVAAFGFAFSPTYWVMALFSIVAGVGNGVFHPVDYTLLNRKVSAARLGHAYSFHGITGSLGWALAPAMLVPLAIAFSWRVALMGAGVLAFAVLAILWLNRPRLALPAHVPAQPGPASRVAHAEGNFDFLRVPAVWMCFGFFFFYAVVLSVIQAFAPEAARHLHGVPVALAAMCLTVYMVCSAGGMVLGGFLAADPTRCERVVGVGFGIAALIALVIGFGPVPALAVPALFGAMGFASGIAGPSRDLLVKRSTPENATGRVYGIVYSGLDIGQAIAPLIFGALMDHGRYQGVWLGLVLMQVVLIASAFNVRRVRRTVLATA
jgi:FSR family fosmidomycin resistance protein-like MFS transporter